MSDVIRWVERRGIKVRSDPAPPSSLELVPPLPYLMTIDGKTVPCNLLIPPELSAIFNDRWSLAMELYGEPLLRRLSVFRGRPVTSSTIAEIQSVVRAEDERRRVMDLPRLHDIVAACFGFRIGLPASAGMAFVEGA